MHINRYTYLRWIRQIQKEENIYNKFYYYFFEDSLVYKQTCRHQQHTVPLRLTAVSWAQNIYYVCNSCNMKHSLLYMWNIHLTACTCETFTYRLYMWNIYLQIAHVRHLTTDCTCVIFTCRLYMWNICLQIVHVRYLPTDCTCEILACWLYM